MSRSWQKDIAPAWSAIRTACAATMTSPICVVRTRTVAPICGNRGGDVVLSNLRGGFLCLRPRGRPCDERDEPEHQHERAIAHSCPGCRCPPCLFRYGTINTFYDQSRHSCLLAHQPKARLLLKCGEYVGAIAA